MERRLAAVLAADVKGYSRLMAADEEGTLARLQAHRQALIDPKISEHKGRIIKTTGDGILAEFASVVEALRCAIEIQRGMRKSNADVPENQRIDFRVGINAGDIISDGNDIFGDGVNVAARLESLAEPGGICVSGRVQEDTRGKLDIDFEDAGEQQLKNIARPVHVYRVRLDREPPGRPALALPDKPSIAVLPFTNISGDPEQEYFSDGITENIITELSRFRDLFVIASNSSFSYKGKAMKVQDVSRELGVRYVLEGSVQKSNDRVRIIAQLIDGSTARHLWAERYDRRVEHMFEVQDEVVETIVATLASGYGGRLRKAWLRRTEGAGPQRVQAFDCFLRGMNAFNTFAKEGVVKGREFFHEALRLDPDYAKAYAKIGWAHMVDATFGWSENYEQSMAWGLEFANRAIECDDDESWAHWALAAYYMLTMRHDLGLAEFQRAIELNPNDAEVLTDLGMFLSYAGRATEGIETARKAMRLNPHYPEWYVAQLGQIYFDARRYEDAVAALESLRGLDTINVRLYLAASRAHLGHADDAHKAIRRALELDAQATVRKWANVRMAPYRNPKDLDHFREGIRKAGLPE